MPWFVYFLFCDQKTYYIGLTHDLNQRLNSHIAKGNITTKEFSDIQMIYHEAYARRKLAENREKQLKGWSVAKKKALIAGNIELLKKLSKTHGLVGG